MQPYNARTVCPKCGSDDVLTYHVAAKAIYVVEGRVDIVPVKVEPEHILRRCGRCSWSWKELPLDAASSTEEAPFPPHPYKGSASVCAECCLPRQDPAHLYPGVGE